MSETKIDLNDLESQDPRVSEQLLPLVYAELRNLAAARLAREGSHQTLQPTALVHEAYVRLVDQDRVPSWNGRGHFFAAAAEAMRRILIEHARHKNSLKAGGWMTRQELSKTEPAVEGPQIDLLALDEALSKLERIEPRKAELVKLRFFAGLTNEQAAAALSISTSTADNDWAYARCWLRLEISGDKQVR